MSPFFKRNEKTTIAELEDYYATKKQSRTGMAWFMAFLSLLVTVLVLVGLFLVSRWAYRTITNSDDNDPIVAVSDDRRGASLPSYDSDTLGERGVTFGDSESDDQDDLVYGDRSEGVVSDSAASTSREPNPPTPVDSEDDNESSITEESTDVAAAVDESETPVELPDTGAGEAIVLLPVIVAAGYMFSRKRQLARTS